MSLFLELMVIRWVPSVMKMVAYYAKFMLISSFLELYYLIRKASANPISKHHQQLDGKSLQLTERND